ncbi:MAG: pyrimidine-nucleoside phosphorylase [Hungatella sp.]|jgi:pyrimidine-nucleoside phosphorylase|nr:pyrimidine-nucleoside phosphorylase [Hungatella sp.]MCI9635078.1 pyrimidine-nucleoside phosphorylase [Hungatella sp.]
MRMYDLIEKKKHGESLTRQEIRQMVRGFVEGEIPDYQMAAMLMAICFKGMEEDEITGLTLEMAASGDVADLSGIEGVKVDKHSTGGVGDKTTLVIGPLAAALGVKVAKMSGRGLGHTGGTIDKLESIPGFETAIPRERFFRIVNETGIAVIGQSGNMVPADKKLYALRDVTATVDSIPLIASSIMSKKIAAGSDGIVLDVKTGSGAFMKELEDSIALAREMVAIGTGAGRRCCALITDMDVPLGSAIGNSLEVIEAIETLKGKGPEDLTEVCLWLCAHMLHLGGKGQIRGCYDMAKEALMDGRGLQTLAAMVKAQGGDPAYILEPERFEKAPFCLALQAEEEGFITHMDTARCGIVSVILGAGRERKEDSIDYSAGILLEKKYGDFVKKGDTIAVLRASRKELLEEASKKLLSAYTIGSEAPPSKKLVYAMVTKDQIVRF